jgi:serine/threonine-protein kinase RsbT
MPLSDSPPDRPNHVTVRRPGATLSPDKSPASSRREPGSAPSLDGFPLAVLRELGHYLSEPNARALLFACAGAAGVPAAQLTDGHLPLLFSQITKTFDVFGLGNDAKAKCLKNLLALGQSPFQQAEIVIPIHREGDIVTARDAGKQMCISLGFSEVAYVKVATAISELTRNIVKYAGQGTLTCRVIGGARRGIEVVAMDFGPGIADVELVMSPRYRSRSGMGVGLRGTRRLMDDLDIKSQVGRGTTVTIRKYVD